ncbi:MAG: hypothetical protein COU11_03025 [Candidatus Harrisonbacteria bacterium CG10_big_fil_rev_8_21_14_0_10_49_15]|uniref:Dihydroorotate dehydrogenase domain-containing protein n=1 Tax=Candidatus Harrisonbacteria bacterium CG10_big_fil_rev_8_21_14_0_10_49_15 TaxID=1974587 RepID=A0A2H0UKM8_9BACT|nr:MAG: hypothetical protein COU11_03025 [Candidatus Harrisonbacteria bacterium CG10_big_fil_rev_8_21_14_0_10_49_15]
MRLTDFGPVWGASGVQGFFGEGYRHHRYLGPLKPRFNGMTFVAKTTTLRPNKGNMPLRPDFTPAELIPRCIITKPARGVVLNAVGLSGPGPERLLEQGAWQSATAPLMLSFMSTAGSADERLEELDQFTELLFLELSAFQAPVALQLNFSCPNVGLDPGGLISEISQALSIAAWLGIPLIPKLNALVPPAAAADIARHRHCAGLTLTNAIPWGALPERINWEEIFGASTSPLRLRGFSSPGALSGAPLLPILLDWLGYGRALISKPINAGGGILHPRDVDRLRSVGADSISVGSAAILRPWRVKAIIRRAHQLKNGR